MLEQEKVQEFTENLNKYVNTNLELIKLEITDSSSMIASGMITGFFIGLVGIIFILFGSLSLGYYLSEILGDKFIGFAIIAGFYLVVALILILCRKSIEKPIRNMIIRNALKKKEKKTN